MLGQACFSGQADQLLLPRAACSLSSLYKAFPESIPARALCPCAGRFMEGDEHDQQGESTVLWLPRDNSCESSTDFGKAAAAARTRPPGDFISPCSCSPGFFACPFPSQPKLQHLQIIRSALEWIMQAHLLMQEEGGQCQAIQNLDHANCGGAWMGATSHQLPASTSQRRAVVLG